MGIYFDNVDNSTIAGNYVGTNVSRHGGCQRRNLEHVCSRASSCVNGSSNNIVGGTSAAARNVLSGNNHYGFEVHERDVAEQRAGRELHRDHRHRAGGAAQRQRRRVVLGRGHRQHLRRHATGAGNVVSGNSGIGVLVGSSSTGATIQGNTIGLNATRTAAWANATDGVFIDASSNTTIGGTAAGAGNAIAFNGAAGVSVVGGTSNAVLGNQIYSNTAQGINVGVSGVLANDTGDGDTGANNGQNYPVLTKAVTTGNAGRGHRAR